MHLETYGHFARHNHRYTNTIQAENNQLIQLKVEHFTNEFKGNFPDDYTSEKLTIKLVL